MPYLESKADRRVLWGTLIGGPVLALWYRSLHAGAEALSVSYAPIVSGRLAWLAERTPALTWLTNLHTPEVVPMGSVASPVPLQEAMPVTTGQVYYYQPGVMEPSATALPVANVVC